MSETTPSSGSRTAPRLSAVLAAPLGLESVRLTLAHLACQSIADRIELVLVVEEEPPAAAMESAASDFHSYRIVVGGRFQTAAEANAEGVRAARAPLVVLCEDHCFPQPGWARTLVDALEDSPWAAVGPVFTNANPATAVSRADFLMGYGPWMEPMEALEVEALPGHNSCYRRQLLLEQGGDLEKTLEAEYVFHRQLRASGQRLAIVPRARVAHTNFAMLGPWLRVSRDVARTFAVRRSESWPLSRRGLYAVAGPLIALVRLTRTMRHVRNRGRRLGLATAAALILGLSADAWGQILGYATGRTTEPSRAWDFGRDRYVPEADRESLRSRLQDPPDTTSPSRSVSARSTSSGGHAC